MNQTNTRLEKGTKENLEDLARMDGFRSFNHFVCFFILQGYEVKDIHFHVENYFHYYLAIVTFRKYCKGNIIRESLKKRTELHKKQTKKYYNYCLRVRSKSYSRYFIPAMRELFKRGYLKEKTLYRGLSHYYNYITKNKQNKALWNRLDNELSSF